ncbi:MAG: hypothetical protein IT317_20905 [Anaerolineales bacterium]|nr:hypothetical protein [Anaerolineales bacterium]
MTSPNPHAEARLALAHQLGAGYAANTKAAVVLVSGSTGRGTADKYSDLELDVYWREPPTADERRQAALAGGAQAVEVYPYEEDEWAEDIRIGDFHIGTSTFLVRTMEKYLGQVTAAPDGAPLAQIRLSALLHARLLAGDAALVERWRACAAAYPDHLAEVMLRQNLVFAGFGEAEDALAARDDVVLLYDTLTRVERQVLGALLGLNRVYLPNPGFKHAAELIDAFTHKPADLWARLKAAYRLPPVEGVAALHGVIAEVFDLVDRHARGFDTRPYRERLARRRPVWDTLPA